MLLSELIVHSCRQILNEQQRDGSFKPGCNGPYNDPETPVRNTAHWLITLLKAYELTGASDFKNAATKAADYLLSPESCPMNAAFFCRKNPQKDFSNGLIGQAWVIEALVIAADLLKNEPYVDKALEVFEKHFFDKKLGLWRILNVDGSYAAIDMTFNHQLWFAMSGAMLGSKTQSITILETIRRFLDRANEFNFTVSKSGRIIHAIRNPSMVIRIGEFVLKLPDPDKLFKERAQVRHKENGYHAFNLYAFGVLKPLIPDHKFWGNDNFKKAANYITRTSFFASLEKMSSLILIILLDLKWHFQ